MSTGFNGPIGDSWRTEIKKLKEVENMECESTYTNTKTLAPTSEEKPNIVFEALYKKQVNRITTSLCQKCKKSFYLEKSPPLGSLAFPHNRSCDRPART